MKHLLKRYCFYQGRIQSCLPITLWSVKRGLTPSLEREGGLDQVRSAGRFQPELGIVNSKKTKQTICPVGWGCIIHHLHLCRGLRPPNKCPGYDTKQSDGKVPIILELWGMRSNPLLPSLPGPLRPRVVASDKGHIYGSNRTKPWFWEFTVFAFKLSIYAK